MRIDFQFNTLLFCLSLSERLAVFQLSLTLEDKYLLFIFKVGEDFLLLYTFIGNLKVHAFGEEFWSIRFVSRDMCLFCCA